MSQKGTPRERLFRDEEKVREMMFSAMSNVNYLCKTYYMVLELKDIIKFIENLKVKYQDRYYSHNNLDSLKDTCISYILKLNPIDSDYKGYFGSDYDSQESE